MVRAAALIALDRAALMLPAPGRCISIGSENERKKCSRRKYRRVLYHLASSEAVRIARHL
jgi:hypothetical protein